MSWLGPLLAAHDNTDEQRLTLLHRTDDRYYGIYLCKCGNQKRIYIAHVNARRIRSCGCLRAEMAARVKK